MLVHSLLEQATMTATRMMMRERKTTAITAAIPARTRVLIKTPYPLRAKETKIELKGNLLT